MKFSLQITALYCLQDIILYSEQRKNLFKMNVTRTVPGHGTTMVICTTKMEVFNL